MACADAPVTLQVEWPADMINLGQHVCTFIIGPPDVIELATIKVPQDFLDMEPICRHVCIQGIPVA